MPIAEIFISALVKILFEKLASGDLLAFARGEGVDKEIEKWSDMLQKINSMLSVAEDQQIKNKAAKLWLKYLQHLAYDLDDVLDEFATEQIKLKLDVSPSTIKSKASGFMFNSDMRSKIDDISKRLESITKQMTDLNLVNNRRTCANINRLSQRPPSTSLCPKVYGRDQDIKEITQFLLRDGESSQGNDEIGVIPIVGMGGIGKTTLAQAVYNDEEVKERFPFGAWVRGRVKDIKEIMQFLLRDGESSQGNEEIGVIPIVGMGGIGKTTLAQAVYNDEKVKELFPLRAWVRGRVKDIKEIMQFLLRDGESSQGNDEIGVIPIVGMGGIGKTTLAQAVYNDEEVKERFPFRAWVRGRVKDIKEIMQFLLRDGESSQGNDEIGVIPIVGMGGIGKTTLAQAVYNDEKVKERFPLRAWVCVSDEFDAMRITKAILEAVTGEKCEFSNLDQIQVELKKSLAGKMFLIVLDDVWQTQENYNNWCVLKLTFCDADRGSKVIVTTRDTNVASVMESSKHQHHILYPLLFYDCWSLFAQHAFGNRNMNENENLVQIGKKIVGKCKGLPLSVRVLGGLLRFKQSEAEWKDVLDSKFLWEKDNQILPSLQLSYHYLPSYLKSCFAYCSIFPKDYEIGKEELVLLWIAEGFIQRGKENRQLEDIGCDYFNELLSRSLFQPSRIEGNTKSFMMHDLINDLAQEISGDLYFRLEDKLEDEEKFRNLGSVRYLSFLQENFDGMKKFESFKEAKRLRTFLPFTLGDTECFLASNVPSKLFPEMMCLRVLSLKKYHVIELPDSVGNMKRLRYLDLSFTLIETLPDWVQKLYNLQTLILRECKELKSLPKNMGNLINLRYFDVTNTNHLREMPLGIGNMKSLHMLSNYIVNKDGGSRIRELGELRHIRETLCISGLHNVIDPMDAKGACLIGKEHLSKLIMLYGANSNEIPNEGVQGAVLHLLQQHNNLKELHIEGYLGITFPTWLANPLFTNMVHIEIKHCSNSGVLPSLGQLKLLKKLYIQGMSSVKHVGREFYGQVSPKPFPVLETLSFKDMPEWEDWFSFGVEDEVQPFEHVNQLSIINCPKLVGNLPANLPNLKDLHIKNCEELVLEFDDLDFPSLGSLLVNGVEYPFSPSMLSNANKGHESSSLCNMSTSFQNLNSVVIRCIPKLVCLPKWLTRDLTSLKELEVSSCKELETLLDNSNSELMQLQLQLPVLQNLEITDCPKLVSLFLEDEGEEMDGESGRQRVSEVIQSFMRRLESLHIEDCGKLERLPQGLYMLTCLVELNIRGCHNLISLPDTGFPPTLRTLYIRGCNALESPLPIWSSHHSLEYLNVYSCPSLTCLISSSSSSNNNSIRTGGFPSSLKRLGIYGCSKLETLIAEEEQNEIHCPSLEDIYINNCEKLKYLPRTCSDDSLETLTVSCCPSLTCLISSSSSRNNNSIRTGGFPSSLKRLVISYCSKLETLIAGEEQNEIHCPSLEYISIINCERLKYFPGTRSDDSLEKLKSLTLYGCGDLQNLPDGWFRAIKNLTDFHIGRGGEMILFPYILQEAWFLTNLSSLCLDVITTSVHPSEWGLHRLSSLKTLDIRGPILVSREDGEIEFVKVSVFPLDGMLLPTSLTRLSIWSFPDLKKLSSTGFKCLTSLQYLHLFHCPKLAYFPEGGFPDTLRKLGIRECPLLDKKCEKVKGKYWNIIDRIPRVWITPVRHR